MDPAKGAYGNAMLKIPLDLSKVEDFFIPSNGVFLDNVSGPACPSPCHFPSSMCSIEELEGQERQRDRERDRERERGGLGETGRDGERSSSDGVSSMRPTL